jgi:hypothetical protein
VGSTCWSAFNGEEPRSEPEETAGAGEQKSLSEEERDAELELAPARHAAREEEDGHVHPRAVKSASSDRRDSPTIRARRPRVEELVVILREGGLG